VNSSDIVGYTYRTENYTPAGVVEALIASRDASPAARDMGVEEVLDQIAEANAIDRHDESSFDTEEFPKVIFLDQVGEDETFVDADGTHVEI
jgi:hypothetical protein